MDDDRISARRGSIVAQNGGGRRRQVGIVIGIRILPGLDRTSQNTQCSQYRQNEMKAHRGPPVDRLGWELARHDRSPFARKCGWARVLRNDCGRNLILR
jgi:hypothetical protein